MYRTSFVAYETHAQGTNQESPILQRHSGKQNNQKPRDHETVGVMGKTFANVGLY